jgi:toxin-antitoxin system PIN domain toxin
VILIDANLLIYAFVQESVDHEKARFWLDQQLNELPKVALPWPSLLAFLRITTNPRIYKTPVPTERAMKQIVNWLELENVWSPSPTNKHVEILQTLLEVCPNQANMVPDAHLAALSLEHGLRLCSADRGFARFPKLEWINPLA